MELVLAAVALEALVRSEDVVSPLSFGFAFPSSFISGLTTRSSAPARILSPAPRSARSAPGALLPSLSKREKLEAFFLFATEGGKNSLPQFLKLKQPE